MEICGHCHNVLAKSVDRCTVCGTERVDPDAADVRRRDTGELPSHAPGWAAPSVPDDGIHPDDFLRELTGEAPPSDPSIPQPGAPMQPALPPRPIPATPPPGALAGYLGTTVDRRFADDPPHHIPTNAEGTSGPHDPLPPAPSLDPAEAARSAEHLSTATRVAPDGVAARTTRLDGTVQLGPTKNHRLLTLGAPLGGIALVLAGIFGSYRAGTSEVQQVDDAAAAELSLEAAEASDLAASVLRLDLDGCGIITQTSGFLFADRTILVPQSEIVTDHRPTVRTNDGAEYAAETLGWALARDLAVVRADERLPGGLEWGVSSRISVGDTVSLLAATEPGVAAPVPATITEANTINGLNTSFELDLEAPSGSVVLNSDGFVIAVMNDRGLAVASDDVAPAVSRIVLANERPRAICPTPTTTVPPSTLPSEDGVVDEIDSSTTTPAAEGTVADE